MTETTTMKVGSRMMTMTILTDNDSRITVGINLTISSSYSHNHLLREQRTKSSRSEVSKAGLKGRQPDDP